MLFSFLGPRFFVCPSMIGFIIIAVASVVLWVVVGVKVGQQKSKHYKFSQITNIVYMQIHVILLGSLREMVS